MTEGLPLRKRDALIHLAFMAVLLGGLYLLIRHFGLDDIRAHVERAGIWAPIILVLAKASTIVIAPLGGGPLYPLAGALFGFWESFFLLMLGDVLGGIIAYVLGRRFGQHITRYFFPDEEHIVHRLLGMFRTLKGLIIARLTLIALPELYVYAAGASRARFLPFIFIYTLINVIPTALMVSLGVFLSSAYGPFIIPLILGSISVLALLSFSFFYRFDGVHEERAV